MTRDEIQRKLDLLRAMYLSVTNISRRELESFSESTQYHHHKSLKDMEQEGKELTQLLEKENT